MGRGFPGHAIRFLLTNLLALFLQGALTSTQPKKLSNQSYKEHRDIQLMADTQQEMEQTEDRGHHLTQQSNTFRALGKDTLQRAVLT